MKVNDPNITGIAGLASAQSALPSRHQRSHGAGGSKNDQIQLSSLSQALSALQANSPQRDARVNQLSAQVGGGSYVIDPQAVSGSLIRETLAASVR